ncbi:hypothetical protein AN639_08240 [Candidatus Epulonipiscium fishelsonii]|nr:hypothetical protein AN639_08240 [Epulopiscium sp. SCG-B05WGA-EpuloA1]
MSNQKFKRRLALAMATITSATPMMTSAVALSGTISKAHTDVLEIDDVNSGAFGKLEDAIINAYNLKHGTISSTSDGADLDGTVTSQAYHWTTPEMKTAYDNKVDELLDIIKKAQDALVALNNNYADKDVSTTRSSITQGTDSTIGTTMAAVSSKLITPINTDLSRTTGIAVSYQGYVDGLYRAILAAEELLITTDSTITNATTNGEYSVSNVDGKDVEKGHAWVSKDAYNTFKDAINEANTLLDKAYRTTSADITNARAMSIGGVPVAKPEISREKLLEMANKLYGVQTSGDTYIANDVATATGAALTFIGEFTTQTEDGKIVVAREGLESLIAVSKLHANVTTADKNLVDNVTTTDSVSGGTMSEDLDEDNTKYMYNTSGDPYYIDPGTGYFMIKDADDAADATFSPGSADFTTASVTYVRVSTSEGIDLWGSWVEQADLDTLLAATTAAQLILEANDAIINSVFDPLNEDETTDITAITIDGAITTLQRALDKFIASYEEGQLAAIEKEKVKLLNAIYDAQEEREYTTAGAANATPAKVQQSSVNGTDVSVEYSWVTTEVWIKFENAITSAQALYDATTGAHSLLEYEQGVEDIEKSTSEFGDKVEDGFREDYEEVIGTDDATTDPESRALYNVIARARAAIGDAKIENGVLVGPTTSSTFTVKPSSKGGTDVATPAQWVATEDYKKFVEVVELAEKMKAEESIIPLNTSGQTYDLKGRLEHIEETADTLYDALVSFERECKDSNQAAADAAEGELDKLIKKAMSITTPVVFSIYGGLDLLTTTTDVTNIDGTTSSVYDYKVTDDVKKYVLEDDMDLMINAIFDAQDFKAEKLETALPSDIEKVIADLNKAIDYFTEAILLPSETKYELFTLIYGEDGNSGYAGDLRDTKASDSNGIEVATDKYWAPSSVKKAFESAVVKAIASLNNPKIYPGPVYKSGTVEYVIKGLKDAEQKFIRQNGLGIIVSQMYELSDKINEAKAIIKPNEHLVVEYIDNKTPSTTPTAVYTSKDNGKNRITVVTSSDGTKITTQVALEAGQKWVTESEIKSFMARILVAETAWKSTKPSEVSIANATAILKADMDKFLNVTAKTAAGTTSAASLQTKFETLYNDAASQVFTSPSAIVWGKNYKIKVSKYYGAEVPNTEEWTDSSSISVINNALKAAKTAIDNEAINKITYEQFEDAYEIFEKAYKVFFGKDADGNPTAVKGKLQTGYKTVEDDELVAYITTATNLLNSVQRSAVEGQDVTTTDKWVKSTYYDTFKKAIETAQAVLEKYTGNTSGGALKTEYTYVGKFNMSYFNSAQANLKKAYDVFAQYTSPGTYGTNALEATKLEYLETMNFVNDILGLANYSEIETALDYTTAAGTAVTDLKAAFADKDYITATVKATIPESMEGIRKSLYNNGTDITTNYLWMSESAVNSIESTLKTHRGYYSNPAYNELTMKKYIETLEKSIASWLTTAIKSGAGTKNYLDALRTTMNDLIIESYGFIGKIATPNPDSTAPTGYGTADNGTFQTSDLKGTDVSSTKGWATSSYTRSFETAINNAIKAMIDVDITKVNLEKAIATLKLAKDKFVGLDANADGDYTDRGDYVPQRYDAGGSEAIAQTIKDLGAIVVKAKTTMATLKVTPLDSGADISNQYTLVSRLDRASGKTFLEEMTAAYNTASSMSRGKIGAYAQQDLQKAVDNLQTFMTTAATFTTKGNKEETTIAKATLKKEIDIAKAMERYTYSSTTISGEQGGKYYLSPFTIRVFENIIDKAYTIYSSKYSSVNGTMYTYEEDGNVTETNPTEPVDNKLFGAIGATTNEGIRAELYSATKWFEYIEPAGTDPFADTIMGVSTLGVDGMPIGDMPVADFSMGAMPSMMSEEEIERLEEEEREREEEEEREREEEEERQREEEEREEQEREEQEREEQEREEQEREEQEREEAEREEQEREEAEREEQEREEQEREEQEREEAEREEAEREEAEREEEEDDGPQFEMAGDK